MNYYPVNLDLQDLKVLVVGGGEVAARKVKRLLLTEANITIVSPEINDQIKQFIANNKIKYFKRKFIPSDLEGVFLVIAATNCPDTNSNIGHLANKKNKLVNIVDNRQLSNLILPSVVNRGDLLITIATGGNAPALSKEIRKKLEMEFGSEYEDFLRIMGSLRKEIKNKVKSQKRRRNIFDRLADLEIISKFKKSRETGLDYIQEILKKEFKIETIREDNKYIKLKVNDRDL